MAEKMKQCHLESPMAVIGLSRELAKDVAHGGERLANFIFDAVSNFVALLHGHLRIHFDVHVHEILKTGFARVLDSVREELARARVCDHSVTLSEVAFQLGYTELSPFTRAFKRWTGMSPKKFRLSRT